MSEARDAALEEAARSCGNGEQELWDTWETGYRFARENIAEIILALKKKANPTPDPRDAAMKLARDGLAAMVREWDQMTRYGSPLARAANENLRVARAALAALDAAMETKADE